jgi:hypothetical protein
MKHTFLTIALAAQLAAGGAFAQTSDTSTDTSGSSTMSGTDTSMSKTYGSDWSTTLSSALLGEDGKSVRSESELATEWENLSEDDKEMIRRDCMMHTQHSGGATDSTGMQTDTGDSALGGTGDSSADTAGTEGSAGTQSGDDTTSDMSSDDSSESVSVSSEQMDEICAATRGL